MPRLPFDPARLPPSALLRWAVAVAAAIGAYDVLTIVLFLSGGPLIGPPRWVLFPDFLVFHAGARTVLEGHPTTAYGFDSFIAYFNTVFADRLPMYVGYRPYLYPPTWLLLSTPLGLAPVAVSFGLFMALSAGLVAWFVCRRNWIVGLLVLSSPAALWTMVSGQNSFLNAALFYGGFWLVVAHRPVLGGILLGLIACKPQLWVLVPVVLLAGGQGRALLATLATATLLALASLAVLGPGTWLAYLDLAREASSARRIDGMFETAGNYMTTVLAGARIVGLSSTTALILHLAVAACATAAAWAVARHRPWTEAHVAAFAAATLLISPYNINYDMLLVMPGAALLFRQRVLEGRLLPFEPIYLLGLWLIPNLLIRFNQHHLPVTPALVAVLLGLAWLTVRAPADRDTTRMGASGLRTAPPAA